MSGRLARRWPSAPHLALVIAVVGVSWSAILVRWSDAPSDVISFYRVLFTALAVAPFAFRRHREAFRAVSRRDLLVASVAGVALAVHFLTWVESLAWTSVAASVTLVQTQPVFVAIGAVFVLEERVDRRTVAGILVAVLGAGAMTIVQNKASLPAGGSALIGSTLAVTGAIAAAGYVLAGRSLRQRIPLLPYVTIVYAACAGALFVAVAIDGATLVETFDGTTSGESPEISPDAGAVLNLDAFTGYPAEEWLLFLGMAVGPGLLGHTVVNWALEHVRSTVVSVALLGEPVGATLLGVALLGEVVGPEVVATMAVVLFGIYLTSSARAEGDADGTDSRGAGE